MVFSVTCSRQRPQSVITRWCLVSLAHAKDLSLLSPDGVYCHLLTSKTPVCFHQDGIWCHVVMLKKPVSYYQDGIWCHVVMLKEISPLSYISWSRHCARNKVLPNVLVPTVALPISSRGCRTKLIWYQELGRKHVFCVPQCK
ncbi:hypothetical protein RRG08_040827 [Elysia crispata]|uniref:Uncharacterized protein n=1 Tax=Elysia crispata TaxID=231223 RepID=A0AAE0ZA09_9GAST|nr:hypothetical protein RRG08_040827 [Elysia crispata]